MPVLLLAASVAPEVLTLRVRSVAPPGCAQASDGDVVVCARPFDYSNVIPIEVNGERGRLLVDPGGPKQPLCNADYARRAGFVGTDGVVLNRVGPVRTTGSVGRVVFRSGDAVLERTTRWSERRAVRDADCTIGPEGLDAPVVRFLLGRSSASARSVTLPIYRQPRSEDDGSTDTWYGAGRTRIAVRFDAERDETVVTAPAAQAIVRALGGAVHGPPSDSEIWFDIRRPTRRLRTLGPIAIGPLVLHDPWARIEDYGDAAAVQSIDPADAQQDDIVVSGKQHRITGSRIIRIGREDLLRCAAITFDKRARTITLTC